MRHQNKRLSGQVHDVLKISAKRELSPPLVNFWPALLLLSPVLVSAAALGNDAGAPTTIRLDDFSNTEQWSSARDESRIAKEYIYYRFVNLPDAGRTGKGLRWTFNVLAKEQHFNDLYRNQELVTPFDKISIWVRNPKKKPLTLSLKLVDTEGRDFMPGPVGAPIGGTPDWQQVEFGFAQYRPASWSKDKKHPLELPLAKIAVVVNGVTPGEDYRLDLDDLEITTPIPKKISVVKVGGPTKVRAGSNFALRLTLVSGTPLQGDDSLYIRVVHAGKQVQALRVKPDVPTGRWKVNQPIDMPVVSLRLPAFASAGTYQVYATLGQTSLKGMGEEAAIKTFDGVARQPLSSPKAEVRKYNGVPTLFINNKPNAAMAYMSYRPQAKYFRDFGKAGVDLVSFSATSDSSTYGLAPPVWLGDGVFDYTDFDKRITSILDANPNAFLFPRVYLAAPSWWLKKHPETVAEQADKKLTKGDHFAGMPFAWPGSEKWRQDTGVALRRLIEHIRASQYADRVIGYHIASLSTEEWFYPNFWGQPPSYWGYGLSSRTGFQNFLEKKYQNVNTLRKAWRDPRVDFTSASIPSVPERLSTDLGFFRDPLKSQRMIDFYRYYNETIADTIGYFANVVKDATKRESLFGVFYGYLFEFSGSPESGHLALEKLLSSKDVDFLAGPSSYGFRQPGSGSSAFMSVTEAIKLHGKLWFNENDYRTNLRPGQQIKFGSDLKNIELSLAVQKRELAHTIALGAGMWWFDMTGGWYDSPDFMEAIAAMNDVAKKSIHFDRASTAEIAVVVDEASMYHGAGRSVLGKRLLFDQRDQLERIGAPHDFVFLNDLETVRPYKMYVFLNTFKVDAKQRAAIDRVVKTGGKTAVWIYAPGFVGESLSDAGISSLTGIKVSHSATANPLTIRVTDTTDEITRGVVQKAKWGGGGKISPVFFSEDASAKSLGILEGLGNDGLVVKRFPKWTSVYSAVPNLPSWLLRSIAKSAGVQIINDADDVLYANRSFLAIHTDTADKRRLSFPKPVTLYDVFARKEVARGVRDVTVSLPNKHTTMYFLGTEENWRRGSPR